ncbi:MAG TPA: S8 family peptidase [Longimicrobiales bacterium]
MGRRIFAYLIAILSFVRPIAAQQRPYVDPLLRRLLRPDARAALARAAAGGGEIGALPFSAALSFDRPAGDAVRVGVLVRLREPLPAALAALRGAGAEIGTVIGDIATARVPIEGLAALASAPELVRLDAAKRLRPNNDQSMAAIRADEVRHREGSLWLGHAGHGVIIGIYDTGIDYGHEDFLDGSGRSRLLGLWDQTTDGTPPPGFYYGHLCDVASLEAGSCPEQDVAGHGTHVAGTAAGDGSGTDSDAPAYRYAGVAPAADLLVVKGGNSSFDSNAIIDGVSWIFQVADSLGRPAVVNLSLGGAAGAHDGTSLFEEALDDLSGAGRIVVVAAGNDGANRDTGSGVEPRLIHAMATPTTGGTTDFEVTIPRYGSRPGACNDLLLIDLWYEGTDTLDLTVIRPDGSSVTAAHGELIVEDGAYGEVFIDNASSGTDPANGDSEAFIVVSDCGDAPPRDGTWTLRVGATAMHSGLPVHLWLNSDLGGFPVARGASANFTNSHTVSIPGTAREVVTVGAFVTRVCWPARSEQQYCLRDPNGIGDIARFSGAGPTRDGRLKPEISAPGAAIVSTLSRAIDADPALISPDGEHVVNLGTSMATPHVTGAIAVLLQRAPDLEPAEVKALLREGAAQDRFTSASYTGEPAGAPNNQWGYGKLDVRGALDALGPLAPATLLVDAAPLPPVGAAASVAGTRFPLMRFRLRTAGTEAIRLLGLGLDVRGEDPEAMLLLIRDLDHDAVADAGEPVIAEAAVAIPADHPAPIRFTPHAFDVAPADSASLLAIIEVSGKVPNGTEFRATHQSTDVIAVGLHSGAVDVRAPASAIASLPFRTSVLRAGEIFALSENPVRSNRVVFNFSERPELAGVYTLGGGRVADLLARMTGDGRVEWDLTNDRGAPVAAGVYLVVFDVAGRLVRRKLFIVRPAIPGGQ